jgi:hypothetical protein
MQGKITLFMQGEINLFLMQEIPVFIKGGMNFSRKRITSYGTGQKR